MNNVLKMMFGCLMLLFSTEAWPQDFETLIFAEKFRANESASIAQTIPSKEKRLSSSQRGVIDIDIKDASIPDSVKICANVAATLWQPYLNNKFPIKIKVFYEDLDTDDDMRVEVIYYPEENVYYPKSLYAQLYDKEMNDENTPVDALIYINKRKPWDCSYNTSINASTRSMTYALMRAIAVSLGFGSSVTQKTIRGKDIIAFSENEGCSIFDEFIFSSQGKYLKDISNIGNRENPELTAFVQPEQGTYLYALKQDDRHKLYAPEKFEIYKSLIYLDNSESLMHYDLKTGTKPFTVDATTVELLNAIGWGLDTPKTVEIVGQGIDDTGMASAYEGHSFSLKKTSGGIISEAQWCYTLSLPNGKDTIISQAVNTLSFQIGAVDDESKYLVNVDGDIPGKIMFTGLLDGKKVEDVFYLSLGLKPQIRAVNIIKKESSTLLDYYNLVFNVEYSGAEMLYVCTEEEYNPEVRRRFVYEPFMAHVFIPNIISFNYAWIDIEAENKYGKELYTIELPPFVDYARTRTSLNQPEIQNKYAYIEVYDDHGRYIRNILQLNELRMQERGLYILKFYTEKGCVKTTKYLKP